jgi:hypothetical protein
MLDLDQHQSIGSALREALDRWPNETCLIESDRDRERTRLNPSPARSRTPNSALEIERPSS